MVDRTTWFVALDDWSWRIVRAVYAVLAIVAMIGICLNTILLITTIRTKSFRSVCNILIGCCALFDILHQMGYLIQCPILFADYYIDSFICSVMQFIPEMGFAAGAFCVLSTGFDRMISVLFAMAHQRLSKIFFIKLHFLIITSYCGYVAYLMISYWTPKKLLCSIPAVFHGDALGLWSQSLSIVNGLSVVVYCITWKIVKRKTISHTTKRVFLSIIVVMAFDVSGWFISSFLINLSRIIADPNHRTPFHYVACLFVNMGISVKTIVYYSISGEYRRAIRSFLAPKRVPIMMGAHELSIQTAL